MQVGKSATHPSTSVRVKPPAKVTQYSLDRLKAGDAVDVHMFTDAFAYGSPAHKFVPSGVWSPAGVVQATPEAVLVLEPCTYLCWCWLLQRTSVAPPFRPASGKAISMPRVC